MNPALMLCRNGVELTRRAIESVLSQDIETTLYVVDNDSSDGTAELLQRLPQVRVWRCTPGLGVSKSWNFGLTYFFDTNGSDHVLVLNNDIILRKDCHRELLEDGGDFVTAVSVDKTDQIAGTFTKSIRPHPDFSCYLIRRKVWNAIGKFDETMMHYCSDGDYHLRMHQADIPAYTIGLPFYHYASGTLKVATELQRLAIEKQADLDRDTFEKKWGCKIGSPEYYRKFSGEAP